MGRILGTSRAIFSRAIEIIRNVLTASHRHMHDNALSLRKGALRQPLCFARSAR